MLTNKWGKVTIDRFASHTNKKTQRFNSKYICPGSEGVNAFSVDWSNENNLLVPPVYLIPKTIKHFMSSKYSAKAILLCPYWPSSTFWPLLFKAGGAFQSFIKDVFVIEDVSKYIKYITDKAVWSSSAILRCQSCCVMMEVQKKIIIIIIMLEYTEMTPLLRRLHYK